MTKRQILKAVVLAVAVFVVVFIVVGGLFALRRGFSARDNPSWMETVAARTARSMAMPAQSKLMKNPTSDTSENLAEARTHWANHCAICHANNGNGDTEIGRNLYPKPPDMRLTATQSLSDGELYYTVNNGIRLTGMPAWGQAGQNDEDSWKLVHFIRHLPRLTPEEEREMEALNPKGPEERQEEKEEEEFLNQDQPGNPAPKPPTHRNQ